MCAAHQIVLHRYFSRYTEFCGTMSTKLRNRNKYTRGNGLLEPILARIRARRANRLIPSSLRAGRVLDIGCGSYPYFLSHTAFKEKYAIEKGPPVGSLPEVDWHHLDLNVVTRLPFPDSYFSVVTMLAVVEHLDPAGLVGVFQEIYRVLEKGGMCILTTPAAWSDPLLALMARMQLVSAEEIDEHEYTYTLPLLGWYFGSAGFELEKVNFGYFELMLNMWATAER